MPLSSETIQNKALSGRELSLIIQRDLQAVLDKDGLFTPYCAYGRVSYELTIKLHLDNPTYPEHEVKVKPKASQRIEGPPPLANASEDSLEVELERQRRIDSPNAARVENDLPITVQIHSGGKLVEKEINYDRSSAPASGSFVDRDKSRKKLGKVVKVDANAPDEPL